MKLFTDDQIEWFKTTGLWTGRVFDDHMRANVERFGDRTSLVDPPDRAVLVGGSPKRLTWNEVAHHVDALASVLHDAGVRADDVVGIQLPNIVELPITYLAITGLGAIASPFPAQYRQHELEQLGGIAGMSSIVTAYQLGNRPNAELCVELKDRLPGLERVFAWGGADVNDAAGVTSIEAAIAAVPADRPDVIAASTHTARDCATLCWTSGTESVPKGVPRSHGDWEMIGWTCIDGPRVTSDDVLLNPFPMVNAGGFGGMFIPWLVTGAQLVQHHPFNVETFLDQIEQEAVTYSVAPPAVLNQIVFEPHRLEGRDISSIRVLASGSAPLSPSMIDGWDALGVEVVNMYGSNEGITLVSDATTVPDPRERAVLFPRWGVPQFDWTIRTAEYSTLRLVDLETGAEIADVETPGELRIKGPTVFAGYWGDVKNPFDDDGWYMTGDIVEYTGDNAEFVRFVDRAKDLIIRGGTKISAAAVEAMVVDHPQVAEVAAVAYPDELLGERVCIVVVPNGEPPTLDDIVEFLRAQQIASYKLPERIEIVDELPRNPVGKVLKRDLRDQIRGTS